MDLNHSTWSLILVCYLQKQKWHRKGMGEEVQVKPWHQPVPAEAGSLICVNQKCQIMSDILTEYFM